MMKCDFLCVLCNALLVTLEKEVITQDDKNAFLIGSVCDCGGTCKAVDVPDA